MAVKLYEQGKKDGLSNEVIRKDIVTTLEGIVKERRLRKILPAELKRSYTHALTSDSALSAEFVTCDTPGWEQVAENDHFKVVDVSSLEPFNGAIRQGDYGSIEELKELCDSILDDGLVHPILVRPVPSESNVNPPDSERESYEVVSGVRRLFALRRLRVKTTPVIIKDMSDLDARIFSLTTNIHFKPLKEAVIQRAKQRYAANTKVTNQTEILNY